MGAKKNATIMLKATVPQIAAIVRDANFATILKMTPLRETPIQNGVMYELETGVAFTSWGEDITITITSAGPDSVSVDIRSACTMPTQVIDYGRNNKNISRICDYIQRALQGAPTNAYPQQAPQYPAYAQPQQVPPVQPIPAQPVAAPVSGAQPKCFCIGCGNPLTEVPGHCPKCGRFCPGV